MITHGDIFVGGGIRSGDRIMTPGVIDCKKRIFAGLQPNATSNRCDKTIMCKELRNGEICYGELCILNYD